MTQDAPYLAATLNPSLAVPTLPATSLNGSADTLDASVRLSATLTERLRLAATLSRNERDNQTASAAYPSVSTDMFLGATPRVNLPYSFTRDHAKLSADYRGPSHLKLSAGADYDTLHRTLQETDATRESTLWARITAQPRADLSASLKLAHAERNNNGYNVVLAVQPIENPLRNLWVTETALTTSLNTAYFAEQVGTFVIFIGGAMVLSGIGFAVLTLYPRAQGESKKEWDLPHGTKLTYHPTDRQRGH